MTEFAQPLEPLIDVLLEAGLRVYYREPLMKHEQIMYLYYTDGTRIGYAQAGEYGGVGFSTVHKPNKQTGTGFQMMKSRAPTLVNAMTGFSHCPGWATDRDRASVVKWKDWAEFQAAESWSPLIQFVK